MSRNAQFLYSIYIWKYRANLLWRESIRPSLSALSILYLGNFTNWKHSVTIFWSIIKRQTSGTTRDSEWQRVTISVYFSFFQVREEPTTKHPEETSLSLEEVLWRRPIELKAEISTQEEILTVEAETAEVVRRFWSK